MLNKLQWPLPSGRAWNALLKYPYLLKTPYLNFDPLSFSWRTLLHLQFMTEWTKNSNET